MEWDTAAGHAVLSAAGGRVTTKDGAAFLYRKPGFENPPFIARGALAPTGGTGRAPAPCLCKATATCLPEL